MTITKSTTYRFSTLATAKSFATNATYQLVVVLGDSEESAPFMVVTPADASRLQRAGYSLA